MATREELLIEANNRGLLKGEMKSSFDEAVNRGLILLPDGDAFTSAGRFSPPGTPVSESAMVQDPVGFGAAFGENALRTVTDNLLNIGPASGNLLADASALASTAVGSIGNNELSFSDRLSAARERERERFPASLLRSIPSPTSSDIVAGVKTSAGAVSDLLGGEGSSFEENRAEDVSRTLRTAEEQPLGSALGSIAGDVGTILTGKVPLARNARQNRINSPAAPAAKSTDDIRGFFNDKLNSQISKSLKAGGLKVAETGAEGALLAALNDNDPISSAALSAGAQASGSALLQISEGLLGKKGKNLVTAAAAGTAFIQLFKTVTPGGRDRILESTESSFNKIAATLALGVLAGSTGFGRPTQRAKDQLGGIAEAMTTSRRGVVVSLLTDISSDIESNQSTVENVVLRLGQDPDFFGPTARRRLIRALNSDTISVREEIEKLSSADRGFFRKLGELEAP